jgi:preprotein translocase subunit SecG
MAGYGKHSKKYWLMVYLVAAIIVYGLIYLIFIHKSGSGGGGGSFNY